eukprot:519508_1
MLLNVGNVGLMSHNRNYELWLNNLSILISLLLLSFYNLKFSMPRGSKKTKAKKNNKEVSPEIESPSNSPQNNKKNPIKKNAKTKKKSSKKGDGKIIVKNISNIKSKCSKKINVFVGVPTAVERETLKDGTERLVGVIGKGKDTFVVHNYDDLDSNERILENEQIVKVEYTNPNVKQPIKNEAYKVNSSNVITLTPNEIKKQKDLALL